MQDSTPVPVLLLDDSLLVRRSVSRLLEHWECAVTTAANVTEALEHKGPFALAVLDVHLSMGETGLQVAPVLLEQERARFVCFYTEDTSAALKERARRFGPVIAKTELELLERLVRMAQAVHRELNR